MCDLKLKGLELKAMIFRVCFYNHLGRFLNRGSIPRDFDLNFLGWGMGIESIKRSPSASNVQPRLGTTTSKVDPDL